MRLPRIRSMLSLSSTEMPGLTLASASAEVGSICLLTTTQPPQIAGSTASNRWYRFSNVSPVRCLVSGTKLYTLASLYVDRRERTVRNANVLPGHLNQSAMALTAIDWAIVAAYFLLSTGIGFAFTKRGGESL